MKRKYKILTISFVIIIFAFSTVGCQSLMKFVQKNIKKPSITLKKSEIKDIDLSGVDFNFHFDIKNPNSVGLTLSSVKYKLIVEGDEVATGNQKKTQKIKASASSKFELPLNVKYVGAAKSLGKIIVGKKYLNYKLKITFGVDTPVGIFEIPLDKTGKVKVPKISAAIKSETINYYKFIELL